MAVTNLERMMVRLSVTYVWRAVTGCIPLLRKRFHLFDGHSKNEHVVLAHLFQHLDIGAIQSTNCQCSVHLNDDNQTHFNYTHTVTVQMPINAALSNHGFRYLPQQCYQIMGTVMKVLTSPMGHVGHTRNQTWYTALTSGPQTQKLINNITDE